ncbi:hypothetical protein D3C76_627250 [compost metagenome]
MEVGSLLLDAMVQLLFAQNQCVAGLAGVYGRFEVTPARSQRLGVDATELDGLGDEVIPVEHFHGVVRNAHGQCHHLPPRSRSFQADFDQKTWRLGFAQVQIQMDARAVVTDEAYDLCQCLPGRNTGARNRCNWAEHMQVLVLGHAQAEIGAIEFSRRIFQKFDQGA